MDSLCVNELGCHISQVGDVESNCASSKDTDDFKLVVCEFDEDRSYSPVFIGLQGAPEAKITSEKKLTPELQYTPGSQCLPSLERDGDNNYNFGNSCSEYKPLVVDCCRLIDKTLLKSNGFLLVSLEDMKYSYDSLNIKPDKMFSKFGLNLYPQDYHSISVVRKKFSGYVRDSLCSSFSGMLRSRATLPGGGVVEECSWRKISIGLYPVAKEFVDSIINDEYTQLDVVVSELCIVDFSDDNGFCSVRESTSEEKTHVMECVKRIVNKDLRFCARSAWVDASKIVFSRSKCVECGKDDFGVILRGSDNSSILKTRRKFSRNILSVVGAKFREMLRNGYKFEDDTVLGKFSWFRVSRKLLPVAQEEVKHILYAQRVELKRIISESRAVANNKIDRELTVEEKSSVFNKIMKLVDVEARYSFRKVWSDILKSFLHESDGSARCSNDIVVDGKFENNLHYEDDAAILNIRRRFSSDMSDLVRKKFCEIISSGYVVSDGRTIDNYSWPEISKVISPVVKELVRPLLEKEREKIYEVLMKARVVVSTPGIYSSATRKLTSSEREVIFGKIMATVRKRCTSLFSNVWRGLVN
ncbi:MULTISPECIES: hypothetical protein [Candidatus Ichthyocystis]|uniref:Uncharacterized protein n=1 Tax=Candidatus Ichthyocystis hellenicum TaxID=1561003 RepID=A0A0S4M364_9BURK|nr:MULTISPECIES: hypothetical protein [Ichthyocystis]CUT17664.1 hypothetical protein Ark11_0841 [Candidatus Ichthyocystis hellenicum]